VQEDTWTETGRDDDYLYFVESATNEYRVSLNAGPMQKKIAGTWYTLYQATLAQ